MRTERRPKTKRVRANDPSRIGSAEAHDGPRPAFRFGRGAVVQRTDHRFRADPPDAERGDAGGGPIQTAAARLDAARGGGGAGPVHPARPGILAPASDVLPEPGMAPESGARARPGDGRPGG